MKFLATALTLFITCSDAFVPTGHHQQYHQQYHHQQHLEQSSQQQQQQPSFQKRFALVSSSTSSSTSTSSRLVAQANDSNESDTAAANANAAAVSNIGASPFEAGSHDELMYCLGVNLARQLGDIRPLVETGEELATVAKGLLDTVIGRLTEDGQRALLATRGQDLNQLITERAANIRQILEEEGRQMLKQMEDTEGVIKLDTGVYVHVLETNESGQRPTRSSTVKVHYHGSLPDGTVFDSTLNSDPVTFPLAQVIPGWRDGLLKLREGESAMVGIPPEQAYGEEGTPDGRIPGGSTLFFKIQLLEVLSAGIGGGPSLLGADGRKLSNKSNNAGGLIGADGKPLK